MALTEKEWLALQAQILADGELGHLYQSEASGLPDLNLGDIWTEYTGKGVVVAIYDTGVDVTHPDLQPNYDASFEHQGPYNPGQIPRQRLIIDNDFDATPEGMDVHGTWVAGVVAASRDAGRPVGVAFDATLVGVDIGEANATEIVFQRISAMQPYHYVDIVNWSSGFGQWEDDTRVASDPYADNWDFSRNNSELEHAAEEGARYGREGLGTIVVQSAGNDRDHRLFDSSGRPRLDANGNQLIEHWNTNASSATANEYTIVVANVDDAGFISATSTPGSSILVSAFGEGILTTSGLNGVGTVSGTSFSTPQVAGVVALMLEANPNLGYRDVQEILAYTARHTGSGVSGTFADGSWYIGSSATEDHYWRYNGAQNWNGQGLHFSEDYGFGLVDAHAAVRLAESWGQSSTYENRLFASGHADVAYYDPQIDRVMYTKKLPEVNGRGETLYLDVRENVDIEMINLTLYLKSYSPSDLIVTLTSPRGTTTSLLRNSGSAWDTASGSDLDGDGLRDGNLDSYNLLGNWDLVSQAFRGEDSAGQWVLYIQDTNSAALSQNFISGAHLSVTGSDARNDQYIYTDEYAEIFRRDANFKLMQVVDTDGGWDIVNAAATTTEVYFSLAQGSINIIGGGYAQVKVGSVIEAVYGGDANDTLIGNGLENQLRGNRGNDTLDGGAGADTMVGGQGNDIYYVDRYSTNSMMFFSRDYAVEEANEGVDEVRTTASGYVLEANIENLQAWGKTGTFVASGNELGNVISTRLLGAEQVSFRLFGFAGEDTLTGNIYADTLDGGTEADVMRGGKGNDIYIVDNVGDRIEELAGEGEDIARVAGNVDFRPIANVEIIEKMSAGNGVRTVAHGDDGDNVIRSQQGRPSPTHIAQFDFYGLGGEDTLTGRSDARGYDLLDGGEGNDHIFGLAGNDILDGGLDDDTLTGGAGKDTYRLGNNWGHDTVKDFVGGDDILDFTRVTGLYSVSQLTITDTPDGAKIEFGGNSVTLNGVSKAQADVLANFKFAPPPANLTFASMSNWSRAVEGGAGNDTLSFANETAAIYIDLMRDGGYAESGSPKKTMTMSSIENIIGATDQLNYLHGNQADNRLIGGNTADWLTGRGGNNSIDGRDGNDLADYLESDAPVTIDLIAGRVTHRTGVDTVLNVENFRGTNKDDTFIGDDKDNYYLAMNGSDRMFGNGGNDELIAYDGTSLIDGGTGNDKLTGGNDSDTFRFGANWGHDVVTDYAVSVDGLEFLGVEGLVSVRQFTITDTAQGARMVFGDNSVTLNGVTKAQIESGAVNVSFGPQPGTLVEINGTAGHDTLAGTDAAEYIRGFLGADNIRGAGGDDWIEAGSGHNYLYGEGGNDTLLGGKAAFAWMEGGEGNDTLVGGGGQTVMFDGSGNDKMIGSLTAGNVMYSGLGDDEAFGGNQTDWFYDEGGNDIVRMGNGDDQISDNYGTNRLFGEGGNDRISSGSNQGALLDGGDGDDTLYAVYGGNTLLGGQGNDVLEVADGGAIANIFTGGNGADTFIFRPGVGVDANVVVTDFEDGIDHIGLLSWTNRDWVKITDTEDGALITYYDHKTSPMLLAGISASQINQDDFLLL